MSTRITIATALGAIIAALALVSTAPAFAQPAGARTLRVEAPAKVEDPTAALIRPKATPAVQVQVQAQRKAEREAPAKVEDPTAALIRTERARLKQLQAQRKAEREARTADKRRADLVRIRERIAALDARPAGGK